MTFTRAARACLQCSSARPPALRTRTRAGETRSDASVELTENLRTELDARPWSSVAATENVQRPSAGTIGSVGGGGAPSGGGAGAGVLADSRRASVVLNPRRASASDTDVSGGSGLGPREVMLNPVRSFSWM